MIERVTLWLLRAGWTGNSFLAIWYTATGNYPAGTAYGVLAIGFSCARLLDKEPTQ